VKKYIIVPLMLITCLFAQQIETIVVDKNIDIDQSFNYTIKINGTGEDPEVDISPLLDNFSIVMGPNIGSEYKFINGKKSSSKSISWTLIAKKIGEIEIPQLDLVLGNNRYTTGKITMNVSKKSTGELSSDMFLKIDVSDLNVKIGEQVVITYTFFTRIASKVLSTEFPKYKDFWVEKLFDPAGKQINPDAWNDVEINGYKYKSIKIYQVALFPLSQGSFDLSSMIMKIETKEKDPGIRRLFWDDPFFDTFSQRTKARILVSEQKTINVSSINNEPKDFTGAVGEFSALSSLSSQSVDIGTPITYYLKLKGVGNLNNIGRPMIVFAESFDVFDGEISIDRDIADSVAGTITWEYNLIPRKEGVFTIDAIRIPFFDTKIESWNFVKTNSKKITVNKGNYLNPLSKSKNLSDNKDIRYIKLKGSEWVDRESSSSNSTSFFFIIISIFIFLSPILIKPLDNFINKQSLSFKHNNALPKAIKLTGSAEDLFSECPKIIRTFFKDKNLIISTNIDYLSLVDELKTKINAKDLRVIESILKECLQYNYADISSKENKLIQKALIKVLTRINTYA
jgi:hypothetical protein